MIGSPSDPIPPDEPGALWRSWLAFVLTVATTAACLGTIGAIGMRQWLEPHTPLILMASAGLFLVALVSLATLWPANRHAPEGRAAIRTAIVLAVACTAVGAALATAWCSPLVRLRVVQHVTHAGNRAMLLHAMSDRDATVVDRACAALVGIGPDGARAHLVERLTHDPALAHRCLHDTDGIPGGAALRREVADRWRRELRTNEFHEPARACEYAVRLGELPGSAFDQTSTLLACTVEARTPGLRDCCARALHARPGGVGALVAELKSVEGREAEMLRYAFGDETLHDDERRRAELLGLGQDEFRVFALEAGCEALRAGDSLEPRNYSEIVSGMQLASSMIECPQRLEVGRRAETWRDICGRLEGGTQAPDALCTAITSSLRDEALARARAFVGLAREIDVAASAGANDDEDAPIPSEGPDANDGLLQAQSLWRGNPRRVGDPADAFRQLQGLLATSGGVGHAGPGGGLTPNLSDTRRMLEVLAGHQENAEMRDLLDAFERYSNMLPPRTGD